MKFNEMMAILAPNLISAFAIWFKPVTGLWTFYLHIALSAIA